MTKKFYNNNQILIEATDEIILPNTGLSLLGKLAHNTKMPARINQLTIPGNNQQIKNSEIILSMMGLIAQGISKFEEIDTHKDNPGFSYLLQLNKIPSKETLRQRMDILGNYSKSQTIMHDASVEAIQTYGIIPTTQTVDIKKIEAQTGKKKRVSLELPFPIVPLDIDVSPFDNSGSNKEGVGRTYKGCDGYSPNFAYLSQEGFLVHTELRPGKTHVQLNTEKFLETAIERAKKITNESICVRMDAGNDSKTNLNVCLKQSVDFVIKRNPRKISPEEIHKTALELGVEKISDREGKYHYDFKTYSTQKVGENEFQVCCAQRITIREIDKNGEILLFPDLELEMYWTTLDVPVETVIAVYHNHALCEQFHSELKSDLDIERLPSGKFKTNDLILAVSAFTYNLLRIMGQQYLKVETETETESDKPKKRQRMRIKSILKHILYIGAKLTTSARRTVYKVSRYMYELPYIQRIAAILT